MVKVHDVPVFPGDFPVDAPDSRGAAAAPGCRRRGAARRRAGGAVPELRPGGVAAAEGEGRDLGAAGGDGGGWGLHRCHFPIGWLINRGLFTPLTTGK